MDKPARTVHAVENPEIANSFPEQVRVALEPPNIALIGIPAKLVDGVGDALSGRLVEAL